MGKKDNKISSNFKKTCQVCYKNFDSKEMTVSTPDPICYRCWHEHIKASISDQSYRAGDHIRSPFEEQQKTDVSTILSSLTKKHQDEIYHQLFKKYSSLTTDIDKCPSQKCDYVYTSQKCLIRFGASDQRCPKCDINLEQKSPYSMQSIIGFIYFLFLSNKCPKCDIPIQKISGCQHMTCPCGHEFCWFCFKDYYHRQGQNLYSIHKHEQCVTLNIIKKVLFSIMFIMLLLTYFSSTKTSFLSEYGIQCILVLIYALVLDFTIFANAINISDFINMPYQRENMKFIMIILAIFDIILVCFLIYSQIIVIGLGILFIELIIGLLGFGAVTAVQWSNQTWFQYVG